mgnify:CR=1 FL=1
MSNKYPLYKTTKSDEYFQRAAKVIPAGVYGHLGPAEGQFIPVNRWPRFSEKAKGSYFWDVDGNQYIDYMCAYGPNVLGYCDEDVDAAAIEQIKKGNCVTSPDKIMIECAELLVDTVATADWAFFAKNGNDATQGAILTARAHTHRKKLIFFNNFYHGVSPMVQKIDYPGVTPEDVANNLYARWDDIEGLKKIIAENENEIAAIIAQPYNHGNFIDNTFPVDGFWKEVRELCTKHGIVLIVDDVRCGFRLDLAGSDHFFGFEADIICFCKALANGYNMSAICGKEFLKGSMSALAYTGSYWLSAVPFAACIACINKLKANLTSDLFITPLNKKILQLLTGRIDEGLSVEISLLAPHLTSDEMNVVAKLFADTSMVSNTIEECVDCINVLKTEKEKQEKKSPSSMDDQAFLDFFASLKKSEDDKK